MNAATVQALPVDRLEGDQQVRQGLQQELVDQLVQSFQNVGQLQPLLVRQVVGRWVIVDGHHRWAAAIKLGLKTLNCLVDNTPLDDGAVMQRQLIANCLREAVPPLETARAIKSLMEKTGWTAAQAAAHLAFSNAKVTRLLALLTLPEAIVEQVEAGRISASGAYELARVEHPDQQAALAAQMVAGHLTRDGVAGARKSAKRPAQNAAEHPTRVTAVLGESRTITVAGAGLTLERFIEWIEEVLAKARRERTRGTELTTFISLLRDQSRAK